MSKGLVPLAQMDAGLRAAVAAAGGVRRLARALGLKAPGLAFRRTPQDRVFAVAAATGIDPKALRPDLADWIDQELERRTLAIGGGGLSLAQLGDAVGRRWDGPSIDAGTVDLWACLAAVHYVSTLRGLTPQQVYAGAARHEMAARAHAMALAKVVARARSMSIASIFGCSRQNVDNASERYLRARDGDDPDDYITGQFPDQAPRVWEPGSNRLRRAKAATAELWDQETAFAAFVAGDVDQLPKPERKGR